MTKKIIGGLLIFCLIFLMTAVFTVSVSAATTSGKCGENLTWILDENGTLAISGSGDMDDFKYNDSPWYSYRDNIKSIVINDGVTNIGEYAYYYCKNLTSICLPDSINSIGFRAFNQCTSLAEFSLPNGITHIGEGAFDYTIFHKTKANWDNGVLYYNSYLIDADETVSGSYSIKEGTTCIAETAFSDSDSLEYVYIPDSVDYIGRNAFSLCDSIVNFSVSSNNKSFLSDDVGVLFNKNKTELIRYPLAAVHTEYVIPDSTTIITEYAFAYCSNLVSIKIPNNLIYIGDDAFRSCKLIESIQIPQSVNYIGSDAFIYCEALQAVYIEDIVSWCKIPFGYYSNPLMYAKKLYLNNKLVTDLVIPSTVTKINSHSFYCCESLRSIKISDGVTAIDESAFDKCSNLESIQLSNTLETIGNYAFRGTAIKKIEIPSTVVSIGRAALSSCNNLEELTIPFIGSKRGITDTEDSVFGYIFNYSALSSTGSTLQYYNSSNRNYYLIPSGLRKVTITDETIIPYGAFYNCSNITEIILPNTVSKIGYRAFYNCSGIKNINIPNGVLEINDNAFYNCTALSNITMGDSVQSVGTSVFYNTAYLKNTDNWENDVLYVGNCLIDVNTSLSGRYDIKDGTKCIANYAFSYCKNITDITVPEGLINIGYSAFYDCTNLTTIEIPNSVERIGLTVFSGCKNLTIHCYPDTVAESYAVSNKINYVLIGTQNYVLKTVVPSSGTIIEGTDGEIGTITATVENVSSELTLDLEVSTGATWNVYATEKATTPISKTVKLYEGRTKTVYIKVLAQDGISENVYALTIYRNTKTTSPQIIYKNGMVTIAADNCKIIYTTDGSAPSETNGTVYAESFEANAKTVIKAIAKADDKDEYSDIVTFEVPLTIIITPIDIFMADNDCVYEAYVTSPALTSGTFIIALYDDNGAFLGMTSERIDTPFTEHYASGSVENLSKTPTKYKLFLWSGFDTLTPMADFVEGAVE